MHVLRDKSDKSISQQVHTSSKQVVLLSSPTPMQDWSSVQYWGIWSIKRVLVNRWFIEVLQDSVRKGLSKM